MLAAARWGSGKLLFTKKPENLETIISQKKQKRVAECLLIQWSWCKALPGWLFVPTCHQWLSSGHYTRGGGGVYGTRIQDIIYFVYIYCWLYITYHIFYIIYFIQGGEVVYMGHVSKIWTQQTITSITSCYAHALLLMISMSFVNCHIKNILCPETDFN